MSRVRRVDNLDKGVVKLFVVEMCISSKQLVRESTFKMAFLA